MSAAPRSVQFAVLESECIRVGDHTIVLLVGRPPPVRGTPASAPPRSTLRPAWTDHADRAEYILYCGMQSWCLSVLLHVMRFTAAAPTRHRPEETA